MLKKIFQPKVCVALIVALLLVSVCVAPILLGVIYAILISIETEPEKPSEKRKNGFTIAYACVFALFYIIDIWAIVYAIIQNLK